MVDGGVVYAGRDDGSVYAVVAATGRQRCTGGPVTPSMPAIANGRLCALE